MNINSAIYQADQFQAAKLITSAAQRNVQTQMATLKNKGEMEEAAGEKPSDDCHDSVSVSSGFDPKQAKDKLDCAATSGGLTSLMDAMETDDEKKTKEKDGKAGRLNLFGKDQKKLYGPGSGESSNKVEESGKVEEMDQKPDIMAAVNKSAKEIQGDVPDGLFAAAKTMVELKVVNGQPTGDLKQLKEVETAPLQLKPLPNLDIAPIHDSHNKPLQMDMEAMV
jgi:hypothetical protein